MEKYVKRLERLSDIFRAFAIITAFIAAFRLVITAVPVLGISPVLILAGGIGGGLVAVGAIIGEALLSILLVLFLHTVSVVLDFFAQVGEDLHILRRSDWERRQIASGKTQRMD